MELNLIKKKETKVVYPSKTSINFISDSTKRNNRIALITFIVFLLFLGLFVKFAIVDQIAKVSKAESEYNTYASQIETYKKELENYSEIKAEYDEKVGVFLNDEEKSYGDRMAILKMIDQDVKAYVTVKSINISSNTIRITTDVSSMSTISDVVKVLLNDERNYSVNVKTTKADQDTDDLVTADIIVVYGG